MSALTQSRRIAVCCGIIIAALYVVGSVSHTELRHFVQTLPLWLGVALGAAQDRAARWVALPMFIFWLLIMIAIWLFLLHISRIVTGHFSPTEIAMTVVIGIGSVVGIIFCVRDNRPLHPAAAIGLLLAAAAVQVLALWVSLLPNIAGR